MEFVLQDLIEEAFERCHQEPQTLSVGQWASARRSLTLLLSGWSSEFAFDWKTIDVAYVLPIGATSQALPTDLVDVLKVVRRSDIDIELPIISPMMYRSITDKSLLSTPVECTFDRTARMLLLWPGCAAATTIVVTYFQRKENVAAVDEVPFTTWDALAAGLAARLARKTPKLNENTVQRLLLEAERAYNSAVNQNTGGEVRFVQ